MRPRCHLFPGIRCFIGKACIAFVLESSHLLPLSCHLYHLKIASFGDLDCCRSFCPSDATSSPFRLYRAQITRVSVGELSLVSIQFFTKSRKTLLVHLDWKMDSYFSSFFRFILIFSRSSSEMDPGTRSRYMYSFLSCFGFRWVHNQDYLIQFMDSMKCMYGA